ncbi:putative uncharacterized protein [Eubacterium sp. CAG:603]|nr:putative uncharacterized protein [Eubacterium sp. CAG:603]
MNTYVMSDIHGCYDEFQQMLEKIHFSDRDLLICAGDYIDRGTKNYEMMSWISNATKNVIFVRGNHDEEFLTNICIMKYVCDEAELDENSIEDSRTLYKAVQKFAEQNNNVFFDYYGTIGKLINEKLVSFALLCDWAKIVEKMPYFYKIDINKRTCIVVHAGYIESLDHVDTEESYESVEDFYLHARDDAYMCGGVEHGMIIAGHTPTIKYEEFPYNNGSVYRHAGYIESLDHVDTEESYESVEDFYLHARDDAYMCGGVEHGMIIAGHTPTIKYEEFPYNNGNVYRMYDESLDCIFYDIDCGCVMGSVQENAKLACIRLEDEKIYYVGTSDYVKSKELYLDGMMGLVIGDALGVPVEFSSRDKMQEHPVVDMTGYGTYPVPAGSWSDDGSMALASLSALHSDGINLKKIMDNFVDWEENGKFTPAGEMFDEGVTCSFAIYNYKQFENVATCGQDRENSNGNGSLMRILPVCIYLKYLQDECGLKDETCLEIVHKMSALTHAHLRSKMSCGIYFYCVRELAKRNKPLEELLQNAVDLSFSFYEQNNDSKKELEHFSRIRNMEELSKIPIEQINSGGYVIESIEAVLWCLLNTSDFKDCVLKAVNLGDDTDTTAAIAGGLAGIYYGYKNIPEHWLEVIIRREWIEDLCRTI